MIPCVVYSVYRKNSNSIANTERLLRPFGYKWSNCREAWRTSSLKFYLFVPVQCVCCNQLSFYSCMICFIYFKLKLVTIIQIICLINTSVTSIWFLTRYMLLPPPRGYVFTCVCLSVCLSVCLFVCLFVCRQDISTTIAPIFMKVCGRVGHRSRTNPLNCS